MSSTLDLDARGRITLPKAIRKGLGTRFVAIRTPTGIELFPARKHVHLPVRASQASGEDAAVRETT